MRIDSILDTINEVELTDMEKSRVITFLLTQMMTKDQSEELKDARNSMYDFNEKLRGLTKN